MSQLDMNKKATLTVIKADGSETSVEVAVGCIVRTALEDAGLNADNFVVLEGTDLSSTKVEESGSIAVEAGSKNVSGAA